MLIGVSSLAAAEEIIGSWEPDSVVSIHSPGVATLAPLKTIPHLRLCFHDVEHRIAAVVGGTVRPATQVAAGDRHLRTFLNFLESARPERLLIHCAAGLSRSPAFAILALLWAGASPLQAVHAVKVHLPTAQPNRRVLRLAEKYFSLPGFAELAAEMFTYERGPSGAIGDVLAGAAIIPNHSHPGEIKGDGRGDSNPLRSSL
jgi:predicted protein tyrosine phosphatase